MSGEIAYLTLSNGSTLKGKRFGAQGDITAEFVFTTGMYGYHETLTDKSFFGQAVVLTFPMIGNYGIIPEDAEGEFTGPVAFVVKEWCDCPSNFRSKGGIDEYLRQNGVVGLYDIDTRALTSMIRSEGVMNGMITSNPAGVDMEALRAYRIVRPVEKVSCDKMSYFPACAPCCTVALIDCGYKENILRALLSKGCNVWLCPHNTTMQQLAELKLDGILVSNGPGDPADNTEVIANISDMLASGTPMMGICLGHQLMALASGFGTYKLKYGHRGLNHAVRYTKNGRLYTTSQNHGYVVDTATVDPNVARVIFEQANDGTCEGLEYCGNRAFSVQFHPEACPGPLDTGWLFDDFLTLMGVTSSTKIFDTI